MNFAVAVQFCRIVQQSSLAAFFLFRFFNFCLYNKATHISPCLTFFLIRKRRLARLEVQVRSVLFCCSLKWSQCLVSNERAKITFHWPTNKKLLNPSTYSSGFVFYNPADFSEETRRSSHMVGYSLEWLKSHIRCPLHSFSPEWSHIIVLHLFKPA